MPWKTLCNLSRKSSRSRRVATTRGAGTMTKGATAEYSSGSEMGIMHTKTYKAEWAAAMAKQNQRMRNSVERTARLREQQQKTGETRGRETSTERTARLREQQQRRGKTRALETSAQRTRKLSSDWSRLAAARTALVVQQLSHYSKLLVQHSILT